MMKRLILATKLLTLNPSTATQLKATQLKATQLKATQLTATHLTATHLTATHLTATHLTATHLTVWIFLWAALFDLAIPTSSYAQVAEICANGIDDDGDTLIDCDDPDCTFPLFSDSSYGKSDSADVALGDLDGDGDLDAYVANSDQANRVWTNQGGDQGGTPGTYADSGQALGNSRSVGVALGDLDGDGDLDAWVANYNFQANRVWINQGGDQGGIPGTYADSNQDLGNSSSADVALGDLDGDGDLDAWVANRNTQANRVWINQGGDQGGTPGTYAYSGQALGNSNSRDVALGDLDGDGDLDAWVANINSQANRVWINQGGDQGGTPGTYADSGQALRNSSSTGVALGDLDGDGDLDAWVANYSDSNGFGQANRVWINQGGDQGGTPGTYADSNQDLGNSDSIGVALGDLDGDGDLDAWVVNFFGQANRVWINQGGDQGGTPGTYVDSGQALGNSEATDVALGDLDGDGDLDAWVTNYFGQANRVWINQVSCEETSFIRGDVNGDGGIDFSDAVTTLDYLFTGGTIPCDNAADSNDDGTLNIADAIALLSYLFSGASAPPAPFPDCGIDPTVDALECDAFAACP